MADIVARLQPFTAGATRTSVPLVTTPVSRLFVHLFSEFIPFATAVWKTLAEYRTGHNLRDLEHYAQCEGIQEEITRVLDDPTLLGDDLEATRQHKISTIMNPKPVCCSLIIDAAYLRSSRVVHSAFRTHRTVSRYSRPCICDVTHLSCTMDSLVSVAVSAATKPLVVSSKSPW